MTHVALKDELLDAQLLRTVGSTPYGGADVGECLATAAEVDGTNLASWYEAWSALAVRTFQMAQAQLDRGNRESARLAFWRSSSYFRNAGVMLMATPIDDGLKVSNGRQTDAFRRGAELMAIPPEVVEIPFETAALPGYFFRASPALVHGKGAAVILVGGYDGTSEELYFLNAAAALARGYHVLAFDGPGQGAALIQRGLTLRPDWETVIGAALDYLAPRPEVDMERVAVIGLSLGGFLAPRAASAELRVAACVADCGAYDLFEAALARMPAFLASRYRRNDPIARRLVSIILDRLARSPTGGWAIRRGQLVHGVTSPIAYLDALREYSMKGRAALIKCPTFVCNAEGDDISASAPKLAAELTCDHMLVTFSAAEGAGDHCEAGARELFHARAFDWLDARLKPLGDAGASNLA